VPHPRVFLDTRQNQIRAQGTLNIHSLKERLMRDKQKPTVLAVPQNRGARFMAARIRENEKRVKEYEASLDPRQFQELPATTPDLLDLEIRIA
jgi:hypothetical protein